MVLMLFTALTIVLYFVFAGFGFDVIGYLDKVIEIVLIALLVAEDRAPARVQVA